MKRPPILLMLGLVVMWLFLNDTVSAGQLLLGMIVSFVMVMGFRPVRPLQPRMRRPGAVLWVLLRAVPDIVRSNIGVARIVLGLVRDRQVRSGFLKIPLELRDPYGLAVLAALITAMPGTVWVDLTRDGSVLTLHVLDLQDEQEWIHIIKHRYERLLMEIFE